MDLPIARESDVRRAMKFVDAFWFKDDRTTIFQGILSLFGNKN